MDKKTQAKKLEMAGFTSKHKDTVLWVYDRGTYIGYLTSTDDGTTGTCKNIRRRSGAIAEALRARQEERRLRAIELGKKNGDALLETVISSKLMVLRVSEYEKTKGVDYIEIWKRDCFDVIAAAKRSSVRFEWNRDWLDIGSLMIAIPKKPGAQKG